MIATETRKVLQVDEYDIPEEAIALIEDIQSFELILDLLSQVREKSISANHQAAYLMLRRAKGLIGGLHTIAQDRLRKGFLAGKRLRTKAKSRPLQQLWQAHLDVREERLNTQQKSVSNEVNSTERKTA